MDEKKLEKLLLGKLDKAINNGLPPEMAEAMRSVTVKTMTIMGKESLNENGEVDSYRLMGAFHGLMTGFQTVFFETLYKKDWSPVTKKKQVGDWAEITLGRYAREAQDEFEKYVIKATEEDFWEEQRQKGNG